MVSLFIWVIIAAILAFVVPPFVRRAVEGDRHPMAATILPQIPRLLGLVLVIYAVASTSYVNVPKHHLGTMFKVYGGSSLPPGKIVAAEGEMGPQARILAPGFKWEPLMNVFYEVDYSVPETQIQDGQVGLLTALDGKPLRHGQAFADPFPKELGYNMLDAEVFLQNDGQRGPQLTVLTPGNYRLNPYLWKVTVGKAAEIPLGYVGVIKSNVHSAIDFGTLKAAKPENCEIQTEEDTKDTNKQKLAASIVPVGCIGVWDRSLSPGRYYFHPSAFQITDIDTRAQVWNYAGGYVRSRIDLTVEPNGDIKQVRTEDSVPFDPERNADTAVAVKMEGWDVPLELRVVAQVSPDQAACVVASVGGLKEVEDRVLTPSIRAITRDVAGGSYEVEEAKLDETGKPIEDADGKHVFQKVIRLTKVLDLINQRPLIETEIERRIRPEAEKSCVNIREVRLGEPAIPAELLVAVRREQLATQLSKAYTQEQVAQEKRISSEKAKATADQQNTLVTAEIQVQASEQQALAAKNLGQGERDKLTLIAEGQKAQTEILGTDSTVQLRQYELMLQTLSGFFEKHPEVLTTALANAHRFVPQVSVGSGGGGMFDALLGQFLSKQQGPEKESEVVIPKTQDRVTASPPQLN